MMEKSEMKITESDEIIKKMLDNILVGIAMISPKMEIIWFNQALKKEFPNVDAREKSICYHSFCSPRSKTIHDYCPTIKAFKTGDIHYSDTDICSNGKIYNITATPVSGKNNEISYVIETWQDITERKKIEETLRVSEKKFKDLTETTTDWMWEVDGRGVYTYTNPKIKEFLGYEASEVLGKTPFDFMPDEEAEKIGKFFKETVARKEPFYRLENINRHKDGRLVVLETSGIPIFDEKGQLKGYRGIDRDVTERKYSERTLRESEEKYRQLFSTETDAIFLFDAEAFQFLDVNDAALNLYGYSREEFLKLNVLDISAEREKTIASIKERISGKLDKIPLRYHKKKDGTIFPVEIYASTFILKGRRLLVGVIRDITERINSENALRDSEKRYRLLAENVTDVIWVLDMNLQFTYMSPSVKYLRGYTAEEARKQKLEDVLPPASLEVAMRVLKEELAEEKKEDKDLSRSRILELENKCKDGSTIWAEIKTSFLRDSDGQPIGIVGVSRDITQRKKAEQDLKQSEERLKSALSKLEQAYKDLQELDKLKSDFISIVSHELRTPLTSIKNAASILLKARLKNHHLDEKEKELLEIILKNTDRQTRMIRDLLDISKIESGVMEMQIERTDLVKLVRDVIKSFQFQFNERNIKHKFMAPQKELPVLIDPDQISRVLNNLIDNAIKFSADNGEITIKIDEEGINTKSTVADNGIGISQEDKNKLFDKFFKAGDLKARKKSGAGLGLAIAKGIIEAHNGKIWVESEPEKGSSFHFTLPISK